MLYLSNCLIRCVCKKSLLSFSYFSMVIKKNMQNQNKFVGNSLSLAPPPPPPPPPLPLYIKRLKRCFKCTVNGSLQMVVCFLLCHNLRLHMLKTCSIGKTVLSVSCARFKSHICKLSPPPTLRARNPCICPCLSRRRRSTQIPRLCPFSFRRQAE